jgi:hypothetical protein
MTLYEALEAVRAAKEAKAAESGKNEPDAEKEWQLHIAVVYAEDEVEKAVLAIVRSGLQP